MNWFKKLFTDNWITRRLAKRRAEKRYKERLEEIKKRDPFIYK
jgi:hypothetical protein